MKRKRITRTWVCPCCHVTRDRLKEITSPPRCSLCDRVYEPKFSYFDMKNCVHRKARKKQAEYEAVPRIANGTRFRATTKLRQLWRESRLTVTEAATLKRLNAFMREAMRYAEGLPVCPLCKEYCIEPGEDFCATCLGRPPQYGLEMEYSVPGAEKMRRDALYRLQHYLDGLSGTKTGTQVWVRLAILGRAFPVTNLRRRRRKQ